MDLAVTVPRVIPNCPFKRLRRLTMISSATFLVLLLPLGVVANSKDVYSIANATSSVRLHQRPQRLVCYAGYGLYGDSIELQHYAPDWKLHQFNNRASFCCFTGLWLLYADPYYNTYNPYAGYFPGWDDRSWCSPVNHLNNAVSSARYVGPPDGFQYDTITFYAWPNFAGSEHYYYDSARFLSPGNDNVGGSLIVTGCSPWTIYSGPNYSGRSVCVYPSNANTCQPGFYVDLSRPGLSMNGIVSSVRKGC